MIPKIVASTDIYVVKSSFLREGYYLFRLFNPTWNEAGLFETVIMLHGEIAENPDDTQGMVLSFIGNGADEFQSLTYVFSHLRQKFLRKFDSADQIMLRGSNVSLNPKRIVEELLSDNYQGTPEPSTKLGREIARSKLKAFRPGVTDTVPIEIELAIYKPHTVKRRWHCAVQIQEGKQLTVKGADSFRAFTSAIRCLDNLFCESFDNTWQFDHIEDEHEDEPTCHFEDLRKFKFNLAKRPVD